MANFDIICPDHYPMKCNLSPADKDYFLTKEKYKAFFIFQYKNQDEWLQPTIERYFSERTWRLYNAGKESGLGTKFCNICRYALASDFGVVSLTPLNHNVFQEIGIMQGLQKPLLYLLNPNRKAKLPFDIDDQIYIEHTDSEKLTSGLESKIGLLLDKLLLLSGFEINQKEIIKEKINQLNPEAKKLLKRLVLEGDIVFGYNSSKFNDWVKNNLKFNVSSISELREQRFIITKMDSGGSKTLYTIQLNESYLKYLKELLWQQI